MGWETRGGGGGGRGGGGEGETKRRNEDNRTEGGVEEDRAYVEEESDLIASEIEVSIAPICQIEIPCRLKTRLINAIGITGVNAWRQLRH